MFSDDSDATLSNATMHQRGKHPQAMDVRLLSYTTERFLVSLANWRQSSPADLSVTCLSVFSF